MIVLIPKEQTTGDNMLRVQLHQDAIQMGKHFTVSFQRTLRIPDDGKTYPLPPGLGRFPICKVSDYRGRVPESWRAHGGVFIPMYQREALWLSFSAAHWRPNAVKIGVGKINAVSGKAWTQPLSARPQDYVVCPAQPWLDGINAGEGYIRQFVAMPLGMGYTVEGQITGKEEFGGIQICAYDPKPGRFPEQPPRMQRSAFELCCACAPCSAGTEMGLAAGGRMKQKIYPDEYGLDTWDQNNFGQVYIHIVNSMMYREITGNEPPPTPVSAKTYTQYGMPWFDLYDEAKGDVSRSDELSKVKSVKDMDAQKGFDMQQDDGTLEVGDAQVKKLVLDSVSLEDGDW
jgi:hypothetical protein